MSKSPPLNDIELAVIRRCYKQGHNARYIQAQIGRPLGVISFHLQQLKLNGVTSSSDIMAKLVASPIPMGIHYDHEA
jgi:hypothetical protein